MDKVRRGLLEYLSYNCRLTTTQIAKLLKTQRYRVEYYYKKFIKDKLIRKYELLLNYECLGYNEYFLYLKVFRYKKIKPQLIEFLDNHKQVRWAGESLTKYNVRITFIAQNTDQVESFIQDLNKICEKNVIETEILIKKDLIKKESYSTIEHLQNNQKIQKIILTDQDKNLIKALSENPKESLVALAEKSGFSIEHVRQKLKRFESQGFIQGYSAKYNMERLGVTSWAIILIKVNNLDKHIKRIRTILYSDTCYGRTYKIFGKWNLELTVFTSSYNQLFDVINTLEETFNEDLENFDLHITTGKLISTRTPKIIFEE